MGPFDGFVCSYFGDGSEATTGRTNAGSRMYAGKVLRTSGGLGSSNMALDPYQQASRVEHGFIDAS